MWSNLGIRMWKELKIWKDCTVLDRSTDHLLGTLHLILIMLMETSLKLSRMLAKWWRRALLLDLIQFNKDYCWFLNVLWRWSLMTSKKRSQITYWGSPLKLNESLQLHAQWANLTLKETLKIRQHSEITFVDQLKVLPQSNKVLKKLH